MTLLFNFWEESFYRKAGEENPDENLGFSGVCGTGVLEMDDVKCKYWKRESLLS